MDLDVFNHEKRKVNVYLDMITFLGKIILDLNILYQFSMILDNHRNRDFTWIT